MRWGLGWVCEVSDQCACWTGRRLQSQMLDCLPIDPGPAGDGGGSAGEGRPVCTGQSTQLESVGLMSVDHDDTSVAKCCQLNCHDKMAVKLS